MQRPTRSSDNGILRFREYVDGPQAGRLWERVTYEVAALTLHDLTWQHVTGYGCRWVWDKWGIGQSETDRMRGQPPTHPSRLEVWVTTGGSNGRSGLEMTCVMIGMGATLCSI